MSFEDLDVWRRSTRPTVEIHKHLRGVRDFGFRDRITRSALSVPSNAAEGVERGSLNEKVRFLTYAKGSCAELRTQLYVGVEIGYFERDVGREWIEQTREISAMLVGLMRTIERGVEP